MTKFKVIIQKPSKPVFLSKMAIFRQFLAKKRQKMNFFQKSAWKIFYPTKALPNCKVSEKTNVGILRYPVTNRRTDKQTNGRTTVNH